MLDEAQDILIMLEDAHDILIMLDASKSLQPKYYAAYFICFYLSFSRSLYNYVTATLPNRCALCATLCSYGLSKVTRKEDGSKKADS